MPPLEKSFPLSEKIAASGNHHNMTSHPGFGNQTRTLTLLYCLISLSVFAAGCSVAEPASTLANVERPASSNGAAPVNAEPAAKGPTIEIEPNGPADTVRVFYKHLRERRFREALFLTNLRPAIEGLTDIELKDFALDFESIAGAVPAEVEINGEIITGESATVTANLPNNATDKTELQTIRLQKKSDNFWMILTVDEIAAKKIKNQGKNYFYQLRIETHEHEARKMLERISKAQLAHSLQNNGLFTDMRSLIESGLLAEDAATSASTGYDYAINVAPDNTTYNATATPSEYGKSGKLSFLLNLDAKKISRVSSKDTGGKAMSK